MRILIKLWTVCAVALGAVLPLLFVGAVFRGLPVMALLGNAALCLATGLALWAVVWAAVTLSQTGFAGLVSRAFSALVTIAKKVK